MTDLTARSLAPPPRPQLAAYVPIPTGYVIHPAANLMRMMTPAEFADLRISIRTEGQKEPIRRLSGAAARVLGQEGDVVDGRNRLGACQAEGIEPRFEDYEWDGVESIAKLVLIWNVERRQLERPTAAVKAAFAARLALLYEEEARDRERVRQALGARTPGNGPSPGERDERARSVVKAAEKEGAGIGLTKAMVTVTKRAPEVVPLVEAGLLSVPEAKAFAQLDGAARAVAIERVTEGANASEVLKALQPPPDPSALTDQERKAVQILRRIATDRKHLVLAAARVKAPPAAADTICLEPGCSDPATVPRPLATRKGFSWWCAAHDPGLSDGEIAKALQGLPGWRINTILLRALRVDPERESVTDIVMRILKATPDDPHGSEAINKQRSAPAPKAPEWKVDSCNDAAECERRILARLRWQRQVQGEDAVISRLALAQAVGYYQGDDQPFARVLGKLQRRTCIETYCPPGASQNERGWRLTATQAYADGHQHAEEARRG